MRLLVAGVIAAAIILAAAVALSVTISLHALHQSDHNWCSTLDLLTSHRVPRPADPGANPSREQTYILYSDFVSLRRSLGCG